MTHNTIAIVGGSGFLGSHVADALSERGHRVTIFDVKHSDHLRTDQDMIVGDIMDLSALTKAFDGCDAVYNFAGIADIDEAHEAPVETTRLNVLGNTHVLEAARLTGVKRVVYASTVYVFSNAGSFYSASKQAAERFVEAYSERFGFEYTILRYGSLYGRRSNAQNGIYRLLREAIIDKSMTYHGDGEAIREYIHVTDAAALSAKILDGEFANRHLVLTGQERMKVKDLMRMLGEMLPVPIEQKYDSDNPDSHYVITPYAFQPRVGHKLTSNDYVDLGQGILDCIAYVHECLGETGQLEDAGLDVAKSKSI